MKNSTDWHDALSSLMAGMPQEETAEKEGISDHSVDSASKYPRQKLQISIEKKGRGGKTATIISGFDIEDSMLKEITSILKQRIGVGGSTRGGEILIQGEKVDKVKEVLRNLGLIK